ncbi:hypothetical protein DEJ45_33015 [Streptomyces venezuelae]|uniref:hypothetical protein n=1 Tax=Streptomyces venezuelae TaxID=54571 RepID=UPI00123CF669|nr:hypothetical protein [Streptomyces venezuelae]QES16729.1 hypothetical protein DEJ45_33015 [Streptomyces venezuelae]
MARLTEESKTRNEAAIRAAMERILSGNLPPWGKADLKTLATLARVTRTGFYPKSNRDGSTRRGAYQHLAEEFERRLREFRDAGEILDPRVAQIDRLKKENAELRKRIGARDEQLAELTDSKSLAISQLATQHDEIERLRKQVAANHNVRPLPAPSRAVPFGSCS